MQRVIGRRWSRWIFGIAIVLSCTGMAVTSLPSKSVVLRPEIDLLLDDISDEPTPDNISSLITKARATRSRADAWGLDGSLDENNLAPNEVAHVARYLRSQYPFESLTQRLAYERDAEHKRSRLSDNAIAWLNELESDPAPDPYVKSFASDFATERAYALKQLHSDEVVAFVNREGEGMARMPTYGVEFVVLPDAPAIPVAVDAATANHSLERLGTESQFHDYRINRQQTKRSPIFELHATYREDFAATRNGLIVDADQVAGFAPHAITRREDIFSPDPIGGIAETRMTSLNSDTPSIAETHLVSIIEQVRVPSLREGAIVKLRVAEGDSVTVGQLLARIDDRAPKLAQAKAKSEYETALQVAQSDLAVQLAMKKYELAMSDLRRVEQARSLLSGSVTDEEYENRRLQVERTELEIVKSKEDRTNAISQARLYANDYRSAELNLKQTEVLSPISGTVVSIERHEGEWAKTGETILELLGTTRLKAEAMIDVAQIHQPLVGRRVVLFATMPDGSSKKFRGVVRFENPEINPLDNRVSVWAEISNAPLGDGPRLRPGTRGRMVIDMTDRAFAKQTISTRSAESATTEK